MMEENRNLKLTMETLEFPVWYDEKQQTIWDAKGLMVCDIKGWGKIQFMNKSEDRQNAIGELIVELLNKCSEEGNHEKAILDLIAS